MKRSWAAARAKVEAEGHCRACGSTQNLEAAHIVPRSRIGPLGAAEDPRNIVPLCPQCHRDQHAGALELLPLLRLDEQGYAASLVGLTEATRRTTNRQAA